MISTVRYPLTFNLYRMFKHCGMLNQHVQPRMQLTMGLLIPLLLTTLTLQNNRGMMNRDHVNPSKSVNVYNGGRTAIVDLVVSITSLISIATRDDVPGYD